MWKSLPALFPPLDCGCQRIKADRAGRCRCRERSVFFGSSLCKTTVHCKIWGFAADLKQLSLCVWNDARDFSFMKGLGCILTWWLRGGEQIRFSSVAALLSLLFLPSLFSVDLKLLVLISKFWPAMSAFKGIWSRLRKPWLHLRDDGTWRLQWVAPMDEVKPPWRITLTAYKDWKIWWMTSMN